MHKLGRVISTLRKFRKLTQKELAEKANISYRHFQKIEGNRTDIRISTADEIAAALDVPLELFFQDKFSPNLLDSGVNNFFEMLDRLPTGVILIDLTGKIHFVNRYFFKNLTCYNADELKRGLFIWDLVPAEDRQSIIEIFQSRVTEDSSIHLTKSSRRNYVGPGKIVVPVYLQWDVFLDQNGAKKGFILSVLPAENITPRAL